MPSPIAHLAAGYAIYMACRPDPHSPIREAIRSRADLTLPLIVGALSLLPDLDSVIGLFAGDFARFHNNATHSLIVGLVIAITFAIIGSWGRLASFRSLFLIGLLAYESHVVMDGLTTGRGVMAFWPLTTDRFQSPLILFYGFHWSDGLSSYRHFWTILTESIFAAVVITLVSAKFAQRRREGSAG